MQLKKKRFIKYFGSASKKILQLQKDSYLCNPNEKKPKGKRSYNNAKVAHLVEHDLAKVGVAGSSPVFRSDNSLHPGGGIGRHAGLKIPFAAMRVTVQLRSGVLETVITT